MTDYTNDRWHVDGGVVTHDDLPGVRFEFGEKFSAKRNARGGAAAIWTHAARAWLAAQPKPAPEVGMRIKATMRGGGVVIGTVTSSKTSSGGYLQWLVVGGIHVPFPIGPDVEKVALGAEDVLSWHEVTA